MVNELKFLEESLSELNNPKGSVSKLQLKTISNAVNDLINIVNIINDSESVTKVSSMLTSLTGVRNDRFEEGVVERNLTNMTSTLTYGYFVNEDLINGIISKYDN